MKKAVYAVFDTNVLVSALLSKRFDSPTVVLLDYVVDGDVKVLHRPKFGFDEADIQTVLELVRSGLCLDRTASNELFLDEEDAVFYEVAISKDDAFLVTGNLRHSPRTYRVVSPAQMLELINFMA